MLLISKDDYFYRHELTRKTADNKKMIFVGRTPPEELVGHPNVSQIENLGQVPVTRKKKKSKSAAYFSKKAEKRRDRISPNPSAARAKGMQSFTGRTRKGRRK